MTSTGVVSARGIGAPPALASCWSSATSRWIHRRGPYRAPAGRFPSPAKAYALLEYFMRRAGSVRTRTMIVEHVWDFTFDHASNVVDVYVKPLRDTIDVAGEPSLIQAVRGVGYVLRDPQHAEA